MSYELKYAGFATQKELLANIRTHLEDAISRGLEPSEAADLFLKHVLGRFKQQDFNTMLMHVQMGLSGEAGEFTDAVKRFLIYGKPLDMENVVEELGDLAFFFVAALIVLKPQNPLKFLMFILMKNFDKLLKRYPEGYTDADAIARADKKEEEQSDHSSPIHGGVWDTGFGLQKPSVAHVEAIAEVQAALSVEQMFVDQKLK